MLSNDMHSVMLISDVTKLVIRRMRILTVKIRRMRMQMVAFIL